MWKRAIVVGASSGIGAELVQKLAAAGTEVAALARREAALSELAAESERIHPYVHDVVDYGAAPTLFERIRGELGGLDLIVYCAGVMPTIEEHEYDFDKDRAQLEVNLVGAVNWLNLAAAHMEAHRAGTIVGIASVAGDRGRRGSPVYTASKGGLITYLEALRNRVDRYGVSVVTVKPGPVRTPMTAGLEMPFMIEAGEAAEGILKLAARGTGTGYVPKIWWPIMTVIRCVPSFLFRKTNI